MECMLQGLACAILDPSKKENSKWVAAFVSAAVPCVDPNFFVDWLANPHSDLRAHLRPISLSFGPQLHAAMKRSGITNEAVPSSSNSDATDEVHNNDEQE